MRRWLSVVSMVVSIGLLAPGVAAQEADPAAAWLARVNQARLDAGLAPYDLSRQLAEAAQRHAADVATNGFTHSDVHVGSDGSTARQRVAESGYAAWTWLSGELIAGENVWSGVGTIDDGLAFFLESTPHRKNLLSSSYREIGIGVASDEAGRSFFVLDFGARPNVLPIFINDGAASTDDPQIAIHLSNEEARPDGEGADRLGEAIEVRVSTDPSFGDAVWQPWEAYISWTLPEAPGQYAVYVQYRDGAGRTTTAVDEIVLGEGIAATETPEPPTPEPTATPEPPTATPEPTATPLPTETPVPTAVPTPEPLPTSEPSPVPTVQPPAQTVAPEPPYEATFFPTWTPLPTPVPPATGEPAVPWGVLLLMQGAALVLGLYLVLRRGA